MANDDDSLHLHMRHLDEAAKAADTSLLAYATLSLVAATLILTNHPPKEVQVPLLGLTFDRWISSELVLLLACALYFRFASYSALCKIIQARLLEFPTDDRLARQAVSTFAVVELLLPIRKSSALLTSIQAVLALPTMALVPLLCYFQYADMSRLHQSCILTTVAELALVVAALGILLSASKRVTAKLANDV